MDIIVQRQLEDMGSGNGAYLGTFLRLVRRAGMDIRIVFAPRQSFGNRPWAGVHPALSAHVQEIVWPGAVRIAGRYWSLSPRVWMRFAVRLLQEAALRLGARITLASYLGREMDPQDARGAARACDRGTASITLAEYSSAGPALKQLTRPSIHACLMHDLLSDRGDPVRAGGPVPEFDDITLETELGWLSTCQLIFFASAGEMARLSPHLPGARLAWVAPDAPDYPPPDNTGPPRVVFIGTVHRGNTDALGHFLTRIWPEVKARMPGLEFHIIGSVGRTLTPQQAALPGVKILGRVDSLGAIGGPGAIAVAPTRLATGVSIKIAEYLLLGMPTVAYPLALEGFGNALDGLVQLAGDEAAFADEIVSLAGDPGRRRALSDRAPAETRRALNNENAAALIRSALNKA